MNIVFSDNLDLQDQVKDNGIFIFPLDRSLTFCPVLEAMDEKLGNGLEKLMAERGFKGEPETSLDFTIPLDGRLVSVMVIGLGPSEKIDGATLENAGALAVRTAEQAGFSSALFVLEQCLGPNISIEKQGACLAFGAKLASYRFDRYSARLKFKLDKVCVTSSRGPAMEKAFKEYNHIAAGIFMARDLVAEPSNVINPETMAEFIQEQAAGTDLKVKVLSPEELESLGMNAILAVGQGSATKPRVVVMEWNKGGSGDSPLVFVGKGITFDSGGISIKGAKDLWKMKADMGGAATVTGLMFSLAAQNAPVNVVGIVSLAENMPSSTAQRPGDVIVTPSGTTVEVVNTDAEGRLVLIDALWYAGQFYQPACIVDLATLTYVAVMALGAEYAPVMSNDDDLARVLIQSGRNTGEYLWQLPLSERAEHYLESEIADLRNYEELSFIAESIIGGQFLKKFIKPGTAWAHIDIAGVAWAEDDRLFTVPKGGRGFGVRLLNDFVRHYNESKGDKNDNS